MVSLQEKHNIGAKPAPKENRQVPKDFEGKTESFATFGVESDEETRDEEEEESDFEEFEETYRAVPEKKKSKK